MKKYGIWLRIRLNVRCIALSWTAQQQGDKCRTCCCLPQNLSLAVVSCAQIFGVAQGVSLLMQNCCRTLVALYKKKHAEAKLPFLADCGCDFFRLNYTSRRFLSPRKGRMLFPFPLDSNRRRRRVRMARVKKGRPRNVLRTTSVQRAARAKYYCATGTRLERIHVVWR